MAEGRRSHELPTTASLRLNYTLSVMRTHLQTLTIEQLAERLGLSARSLRELASKAPGQYSERPMPKKNGGHRMIEEPCPSLKALQQELLKVLLHYLPVHPALFGGPRTSIKLAVAEHVHRPLVVTLDIKDFFPSVKSQQIRKSFLRFGSSHDLAGLLTRLVSHSQHLPQGAPTSPCIGRLVLHRFATELTNLLKGVHAKCAVSIYVDDITISGPEGIQKLIPVIYKMLERHGFQAKKEKTQVMAHDDEQVSLNIRLNRRIEARTEYLKEIDELARRLPPTNLSLKGKKAYVKWLRQ